MIKIIKKHWDLVVVYSILIIFFIFGLFIFHSINKLSFDQNIYPFGLSTLAGIIQVITFVILLILAIISIVITIKKRMNKLRIFLALLPLFLILFIYNFIIWLGEFINP